LNDSNFIHLLIEGNEKAFSELVITYQNMVYNTVLSMVQNVEEAEDLAQEVFIQVFQSINSFRGDSKLSTWIYRISITKALDLERKKRTLKRLEYFKNTIGIGTREEETISDFNHPGIDLLNKEKSAILFKALKKIPENQRIAFTLIKAEGLSYAEVGEIMKISTGAIESLIQRAKTNLKKILEVYYHQ
jgi:RNA polymerase sigma-70 factor (ECF subfamily)